ncbi:hypothetical protein L3Q82_008112 [Scortum barcoo]|uniref:Uncharacterized protein n=1 Tax=Scortum barcoo TaxID=214431 RepID=A0ACB8WNY7_9TELE|nr:hypothetical protein L3Q82_008112 [Scortum barcoo]
MYCQPSHPPPRLPAYHQDLSQQSARQQQRIWMKTAAGISGFSGQPPSLVHNPIETKVSKAYSAECLTNTNLALKDFVETELLQEELEATKKKVEERGQQKRKRADCQEMVRKCRFCKLELKQGPDSPHIHSGIPGVAGKYIYFPAKEMKEQMSSPAAVSVDRKNKQALLSEHGAQGPIWQSGPDKYSRLDRQLQNANSQFIEEQQVQQQLIAEQQDEQLELVSGTIGVLKNMSERIGMELDEQAVMLDDFTHEIDNTHSRLDNVMKKLAKVSHMTSGNLPGNT